MQPATKTKDHQNMIKSPETVSTLVAVDLEVVRAKKQFQQLLRRQTTNRWYNKNILYPKERIDILFGLVQKISKTLELGPHIFCQAIHIFDAMISKFPISRQQMFEVALVSLQIASKIHQLQGNILTYAEMSQCLMSVPVQRLSRIEKTVIEQLNFELNMVGPFEIMTFLLPHFFNGDYDFFYPFKDSTENKKKFCSLIFKLILITLVEYEFYKFTSVAVALSVIIFGRFLMDMEPWPSNLADFAGFSVDNVIECLNMLHRRNNGEYLIFVFQKLDEIASTPDSSTEFTQSTQSSCSPLYLSTKYFLSEKVIDKFLENM